MHVLRVLLAIAACEAAVVSDAYGEGLGAANGGDRATSAAISRASVRAVLKSVADWQIADPGDHDLVLRLYGQYDPGNWVYATFYAGLTEWASIAEDPSYWDYLRARAEELNWGLIEDKPYHADHQLVGEMYMALYRRDADPAMIESLKNRLDWILSHPVTDRSLDFPESWLILFTKGCTRRWCWSDALFMAPATWIQLSNLTGNPRYREFADREFWAITDHLFDHEERLYYRDNNYFDRRGPEGEKVFWSRGNGWVFAGIAKILQQLPADHPSRPRYVALFRTLAERLAGLQRPSGFWPSSLLTPALAANAPETSGTALHIYAMAWGINNGLLDRQRYQPTVVKGWNALVSAVHPDGKLGWVQPIGVAPSDTCFERTEPFAAGAFLLAGRQLHQLAANE